MVDKTQDEKKQDISQQPQNTKRRHPYTMEHSKEEMFRRMRSFPERAAKFLEKLNADREKNAG
jgi:hypothetical protein